MAYFNYYFYKKLIRTFINFLFSFFKKHKKILIFLLLFISYLLISNKCFAFNVEYNDIVYDVPDFPFDMEEHPEWVFGKKLGNQFAVGYINNTGNNKTYTNNTGVTNVSYATTVNTSVNVGEWTWYYTNFNSSTWSTALYTSHGFLDF